MQHLDVVVLGRYTARAKGTGAPLDVPFAHVWRFRDGRAVRFHQFTDTRGWVEALTDIIADNAELLARGQDASFQNKVHIAMDAKGFGQPDDKAAD